MLIYFFAGVGVAFAAGDLAGAGVACVLLLAAGDVAGAGDALVLALALLLASVVVAAGVAAGIGAGDAFSEVLMTELEPRTPGNDSSKAVNIKPAAAPIVILESKVCVPRAPKAVVEVVLANNAPASALPGWSSTDATNTMQEIMKRP